ncbi:hypothetical protein PSY19_24450, partial [Shigella flexneri]|nr:hypothetical protein [Shigella flexneri]
DSKSAMVLEDLIGQFLYGSKGDDNKIFQHHRRLAILNCIAILQDSKSAMVLEDLIGQFLYGSKGDDNK